MSEPAQILPKAKKSVALSGVAAGNSAVCTVGRTGNDLHYRGYDIADLAQHATFEEVACLLVHEVLPNRSELAAYRAKLKALRGLPAPVKAALEVLPAATHPMDVMRTGASVLGTVLPEKDDHAISGRARYRRSADGELRLDPAVLVSLGRTMAGASIRRPTTNRSPDISCICCTDARPSELHTRALDQVADPVCRARIQRLDLRRARDCRHQQRFLLRDHRRDRRVARAQARRRQRGGDGNHLALSQRGRGRGRHPRARGAQGNHHRFRPPGVHDRRSAQSDHQGNLAQAVRGRAATGVCSTSPSASRP